MYQEPKKFSKRHWYGLLFLMIVLGIVAVWQGTSTESADDAPVMQTVEISPEFATMFEDGKLGDIQQGTYTGLINGVMVNRMPINYVYANGYAVVEGDILIKPDMPRSAGLTIKKTNLLWPDGIVPYEIAASLPDQFRIHDAIEHWEEHTSIRFVERTDDNKGQYPNYVRFKPSGGCSSYVGMQGGGQPINLARACSTGNTIHEIGHALGLWHEQSRSDRDDYVDVRYENIISMYAFNFDKQIENGVDHGEYDYGSLMHYPRWAFSKNGKDTIVPHDDNAEIGQRDGLSAGDIAAIEDLYSE